MAMMNTIWITATAGLSFSKVIVAADRETECISYTFENNLFKTLCSMIFYTCDICFCQTVMV